MKYIKLFEGFATTEGRNLNNIAKWLGYDDFEEFIGDNPGCYEVIIEWIIEHHSEKLNEIESSELENVGIYLDELK